ncbi:uncharacterized protein [Asterias amurensis]|uniref:uncharacterized protein n=1 Tax=Asterias amurensis TaxID=7602 RepID=UPI003AB5DFE2
MHGDPASTQTPEDSEHNISNQDDLDKIQANSYVAAKFAGPSTSSRTTKTYIYMAMVTDRQDDSLWLRFMRRTDGARYEFTSEPLHTYPVEDVIKIMTTPIMVNFGRAYHYQFSNTELEDLTSNKQFLLK